MSHARPTAAAPQEGTGLATKTRIRPKLQPPSLWKVVLHNDDFTTQDFVVFILKAIFRRSESEAVAIMLSVHRKGIGVAGVYPRDVAETKLAQVRRLAEQRDFPLLCTLEPEEVDA